MIPHLGLTRTIEYVRIAKDSVVWEMLSLILGIFDKQDARVDLLWD